jgi:hypothetical protein
VQTPELKEIFDLSENDFERHPVWYAPTAAGPCRPWDQPFPAPSKSGAILVRASFHLADGTRYPGFFTVVDENWNIPPAPHLRSFTDRYGASALLGVQQPRIFLRDQQFSFWGGRRGIPMEKRQEFYAAIGRTWETIFPLKFSSHTGLATGIVAGQVDGFYRPAGEGRTDVEF